MKKCILSFMLGGLLFFVAGASAAYVYTAKDIGYTPSDENWSVTNASDALSSLKDDLNQVSTDVNNYKNEIIEVLNNNGGELSNSSSMEDIVTSINDITADDPSQFLDSSDYIAFGDASSTYLVTTKDWNKVPPVGRYVFNAIVLCNFAEGNNVENSMSATGANLSNVTTFNSGKYVRTFSGEVEVTSSTVKFTFDVKGSSSGRVLLASIFLRPVE